MVPEKSEAKRAPIIALGRQIRKVREEHGFSQESFAAAAGIGRAHYGGIERGVHNISALNLMRIAAALKVEVGQLFPSREEFSPLLTGVSTEDMGE
jgi:transcriptional regulator with XRE-family HTH domain